MRIGRALRFVPGALPYSIPEDRSANLRTSAPNRPDAEPKAMGRW
jgi:hypothetical protein